MLSAAEIRSRYLRFFEERGHKVLPSDSLVPANDPTLLFTGAGMNQFKDMFLGKGALPWKRITTSQKCLRVPDLENVGYTPRHHTFFEMLGNFSFGDYFKQETIPWEWQFFRDALGIPAERMVVTVYTDDDEAFGIWTKVVGLAPERVFRFGEKENFWPAEAPSKGPNGPCGPCSEIYYDGRPGEPLPSKDGLKELPGDRFTEIGNCVFTQFDRQSDGSLVPLPQKNIDVGLGLERIAAVLQGRKNNFETELFTPYLDHLGRVSGVAYGSDPQRDIRMRRIADHVRAITFCIADGALPSNEGRGYVVRKILRRAARDGYELGLEKPFLYEMVDLVGQVMGDAYPEVRESAGQCRAVIRGEEESFATVYRQGMARLEEYLRTAKPGAGPLKGSGDFAFQLHDTYGFPVDITMKVMEDRGVALDEAEFDAAMEAQRQRARAAMATADAVFTASLATKLRDAKIPPTRFTGYESLAEKHANLFGMLGEGDALLASAAAGQKVILVCDVTPFYAQGGGQVGDRGTIRTGTGVARVTSTTAMDGYHLHHATVTDGMLRTGDRAELHVDETARRATERNHTATHLLHAALRTVLGTHVSQAGSEVAPERLRFDYTHPEKPSAEQLQRIEEEVNAQILLASPVQAVVRDLADARGAGFMALFGEKYGDRVRTLQVGEYSRELCGGTHVQNSGNIGAFRITTETAVSAGTRRMEAVTGTIALQMSRDERRLLSDLAQGLKVAPAKVGERVGELLEELKKVRKDLEKALTPDYEVELQKLLPAVASAHGVHTLVAQRPGLQAGHGMEVLRLLLKAKDPVVAVLFCPAPTEVGVVAAVSPSLHGKLKAGDLVKAAATTLGGGGGGKPDLASGKGKDPSKLAEAMAGVETVLRSTGLLA